MVILSFTKLFIGGILDGIEYKGTMPFVSEALAIEWATVASKGIDKPIGGSPYRVISWSVSPTN